MSLALILALHACAPTDALPAAEAPPPQPMILLAPPAALPGDRVEVELFGAIPRSAVQLGASRATQGRHPCPPALGGACLDLFGPAAVVGSGVADAAGHLKLTLALPHGVAPGTVHLQAVSARPSPGGALSEASALRALDPAGDEDGDGLSNLEERDVLGTDPLRADTDRGGVADGDEPGDPLDADDDLGAPAAWVLPGDLAPALAAGEQTAPAASRGDGVTLVVWQDSRTGSSGSPQWGSAPIDVLGVRVDDAGMVLDPTPLVIAQGVMDQVDPDVAWNGTEWLVTWSSRGPVGAYGVTQGIEAARVSADGALVDVRPLRVWDSPSWDDVRPAVASDGVGWAVVWRGGLAAGVDGVLGATVDATGAVSAPQVLYHTTGGVGFYVPADVDLAFASGRYLLVGSHLPVGGGADELFGMPLGRDLAPLGPEQAITSGGLGASRAALVSNGADLLVAWYDTAQWGEVRASPLTPAGQLAVPGGRVLASGLYGYVPDLTAGWDGAAWQVAWHVAAGVDVASLAPGGGAGAVRTVPGVHMRRPVIAGGGGGALLVWEDARAYTPSGLGSTDLYGVRLGAGVGPEVALTVSPPTQSQPDIAGSLDAGWLVTFVSETTDERRLMVQRLDAAGQPLDAEPTALVTSDTWLGRPAVAFDGAEWLVVWEQRGQIWLRRVGLDGQPLDAAPTLLMNGNAPDVAAVGRDFLVVSSAMPVGQFHLLDILGRRVRGSDGALLDAGPLLLATGYNQAPAVGGLADRWLVAWQSHLSHDSGASVVWSRFVEPSGALAPMFVAGSTSTSNRGPAISASPDLALVSWTGAQDLRARRVRDDGTLLDTDAGLPLAAAAGLQHGVDLAWDGAAWRAVWTDERAEASLLDYAGLGDIYTTSLSAAGAVAEPDGIAVAADPARAELSAAVGADGGAAVVALVVMRGDAPYGTLRVVVRGM